MTTSSPSLYTPEQMEEIQTRLLDLHQPLTTKHIGFELQLSRRKACQLVHDFLKSRTTKEQFCISAYVKRQCDDNMTVIELETRVITTPHTAPIPSLYSISYLPRSPQSPTLSSCTHNAHSLTCTYVHDNISMALDSSLRCDVAAVEKDSMRRVESSDVRVERVQAMGLENSMPHCRPKRVERKKVTSAASFFWKGECEEGDKKGECERNCEREGDCEREKRFEVKEGECKGEKRGKDKEGTERKRDQGSGNQI
mmetsp:Transcript_5710/g.8377  ORF Transcript_5710/g.8377 Transcript_5710/m.8377 type:complete len:254 (-) Transcript_5710:769-1530(-)